MIRFTAWRVRSPEYPISCVVFPMAMSASYSLRYAPSSLTPRSWSISSQARAAETRCSRRGGCSHMSSTWDPRELASPVSVSMPSSETWRRTDASSPEVTRPLAVRVRFSWTPVSSKSSGPSLPVVLPWWSASGLMAGDGPASGTSASLSSRRNRTGADFPDPDSPVSTVTGRTRISALEAHARYPSSAMACILNCRSVP